MTGSAGALLVPATAQRAAPSSPVNDSVSATTDPPLLPGLTATPAPPPFIDGTLGPINIAVNQRPADVLKSWAARLAPRVDIPALALEAYGYAELATVQKFPSCGLKWTTLAAIGKVESAHGRAYGAVLGADGRSTPKIVGPPLNGSANTMRIKDTDKGLLDGDTQWDRAVGPMQFIPTTWQRVAVDADNDGAQDPDDIDDASMAAATYLCEGRRDLTKVGDWWAAILTYNAVQPYAHSVYNAANEYGARSRA